MKKRIVVLLIVSIVGISSAFSAFEFIPEASGNERNQVIASAFFLQTISNNVTASSVGASAFYHNKMTDNIGIYANGGAGIPLAFKYGSSSETFTKKSAVFLQTGPYYIINLNEDMLVKAGVGVNLTIVGGKDSADIDQVTLSVGAGAMGAFEYKLIDRVHLVGSLTMGVDFKTWVFPDTAPNNGGILFNIMPSVGIGYSF